MKKEKNIKTLIDVAMKRKKADTVIKNVKIIDVFNNDIINGDIAIVDGYVAAIGDYEGEKTIEGNGAYASPGFIDAHVHIESSMSTPLEFSKAVVPRGTTTIVADPHELANVKGLDGINYIIKEGENISILDIYVMLPSCVPATPFEDSGAILKAQDLSTLMKEKRVLGLGEMMNFPGTINGDQDVIDKLNLFKDGNIDGHSPLLRGTELNAYVAAGIKTDHECTNVEEMNEKIALGMYVLMREGSAARDCAILSRGVTKNNSRRVMFCTDDRHPEDILKDGHIDNNVNIAIGEGVDPIDAIKIASLNSCECYGLKNKGAIAPGYIADILLFNNLNKIKVKTVIKNGEIIAKDGKMTKLEEKKNNPLEDICKNSVNFKELKSDAFDIPLKSNRVNAIEVLPNTLLTNKLEMEVKVENGKFIPNDDLLTLSVVERHHKLDKIGLGIVKGYGLKNGAIATSVSHDSHNIIVIGDNSEDMLIAVNKIKEVDGGLVLVQDGKVLDYLSLPVAGLISDLPLEEINTKLIKLKELAYEKLQINKELDPFIALSFLALPVIPNIKITDQGLFDVINFSFIDLEIK